jgi:NAD/NADP transhydrogenase alpha subunit
MTTPVTQLGDDVAFRFTKTAKRGSKLEIAFSIQGYASLVGHSWRAQLRKQGNRLASGFGITVSTTTVDGDVAPNSSLRVALLINAAGTAVLKPGIYLVDVEDLTAERTWATGVVTITQDRAF